MKLLVVLFVVVLFVVVLMKVQELTEHECRGLLPRWGSVFLRDSAPLESIASVSPCQFAEALLLCCFSDQG